MNKQKTGGTNMAINPGTHFKSAFGADIEIVRLLGEGGQGFVYEIKYNGAPKALKLYKPVALKDPQAFYKNLKANIEKGSPSEAFLWPQDVLPANGNSFGYVMDLRPKGYEELSLFLAARVRFDSYKILLKAALEIVDAFRILHNKGYSYQDLNDGNFFINPHTGEVLICDNDNVAPNGVPTGILGKPRYMAPEVVLNKNMPNTASDRFSLSVILFLMMTNTHPLEGSRFLVDPLTPELEARLYGSEPIFILDPNDTRNRPVKGIHENIGMIWPEFPQYMKDMFLKAFSNKVMTTPGARIPEKDWQKILIRFGADIIRCDHCGSETFLPDHESAMVCGNRKCGKPLPAFRKLLLDKGHQEVFLAPDTIIYRLQFGTANVDEAGAALLRVVRNPKKPSELHLMNIAGRSLECYTPSGARKEVKHGATIPVIPGITIRISSDKEAVIS